MSNVEERPERLDILWCQHHPFAGVGLAALRPVYVPLLPTHPCSASRRVSAEQTWLQDGPCKTSWLS